MTGQLCPECGTPRAAEDGPGCDCGERGARSGTYARGSEKSATERAAAIAAAEDFDPLRIRPYVTLDAGPEVPRSFRTAGPLPPLAPTSTPAATPVPAGGGEDHPAPRRWR